MQRFTGKHSATGCLPGGLLRTSDSLSHMTALVVESKLKILVEVDKKDHSKTEICKEYGLATFVNDRKKIESVAA
jgi:hypothetical protein